MNSDEKRLNYAEEEGERKAGYLVLRSWNGKHASKSGFLFNEGFVFAISEREIDLYC